MAEGYTIEKGKQGKLLIVRSAWSEGLLTIIRENNIQELELNYAKGFLGNDLSFLHDLPDLKVLLLTHRTISDISPIHSLHRLVVLEINTYCKREINFAEFPVLEECVLEWRAKAKSLFSCLTLKKLFINSYSGKNVQDIAKLENLESLGLANAAVMDLVGIGSLSKLRFLGLYRLRKLTSLMGIEPLARLEHLEVNECKRITSIEPISALTILKRLHLCEDGHIESLLPIGGLLKLEEVLFYGSTKILDGNLSILAHLPSLKKVAFAERIDYSRGRIELDEIVRSNRETS